MLQFLKNNLFIPFRDFLYPPLCFTCSTRLSLSKSGRMGNGDARVCDECWSSFSPFQTGEPVWRELHDRFAEEGVVADFLSCYYFEKEGALQQVIHLLKYQGMKSMGVLLGREVGSHIVREPEFAGADYLIPVPLHRLKQRERGYNQCEFLCKGIEEVSGIPLRSDLLRRAKYTHSQTQLNLSERKSNVGDAFEVNPRTLDEIRNRSVILVDDVITTGSTINACARVLVGAGADRVFAASAAVAK